MLHPGARQGRTSLCDVSGCRRNEGATERTGRNPINQVGTVADEPKTVGPFLGYGDPWVIVYTYFDPIGNGEDVGRREAVGVWLNAHRG